MEEQYDHQQDGPARVAAEGGRVQVDVNAVTPRELHAHLENVRESVEAVDEKVGNVRVDFERRFGRLEKLVLVLGVAIASPKLGGPDPSHVVSAVLTALGH